MMDKLGLVISAENIVITDLKADFKLTRPYRQVSMSDRIWYHRKKDEKPVILKTIENITQQLNNLTTIKLYCTPITHKCMEILSQRQYLKTISFDSCQFIPKNDTLIQSFEFSKSLRNLEIAENVRHGAIKMCFEFINCKQLDSFDFKCRTENTDWLVKFLNQLDRCNELDIDVHTWRSEIELKPKFFWNKMRLRLFLLLHHNQWPSKIDVMSIIALCKASNTNAKSDIILEDFINSLSKPFMSRILNNCRINTLIMSTCTLPLTKVLV